MSYVRKSLPNVLGAIAGVFILAAISIWQFYQFVTFGNAGEATVSGGTSHLVWAIVMCLSACFTGFLVFSAFIRQNDDNNLQVTLRR